MEEVDNIIIDSLKNLNCDLDDDIISLKMFSENHIVSAITSCLEIIIPNINIPKHIPASMSARLKHASYLVEHIKSLGFRGDIGYQSILYSNEIEIRRVLMFLIERLPKEGNKVAIIEAIGYVPTLVKEIQKKVKLSLSHIWIQPNFLQDGCRIVDDIYLHHSYGHSTSLLSKPIQIPQSTLAAGESKDYWVHCLFPVTEQCNLLEFAPSLLFNGNDLNDKEHQLLDYVQSTNILLAIAPIDMEQLDSHIGTNTIKGYHLTQQTEDEIQTQTANIMKTIEEQKVMFSQLQKVFKQTETQLQQIKTLKEKNNIILMAELNNLKIKSRTLTVLSNGENMTKLKIMVDKGHERLLDMANQWSEVQTPLLEQYRTLQTSFSQQDVILQEKKEKLKALKDRVQALDAEYYAKHSLEKILMDEMAKTNSSTNRTSYTKRILEIIANIKKQDIEIAKILKDTKTVQKEINTLTGQLDRSFALSDALIFKEAKYDEMSRRSYKQLATLHLDCEAIVQSVGDVGLVQRECRNIEEQIEAEASKDIDTKLKRVLCDIEELRKEQHKNT